ncbi:uncharacterized protein LOC110433629 [Sorghum bicolor]|uniref:uncharacterized protein LOC110433629 n=1 Tax=Sorghum bicolor TaxID=4558 RepID=UPI000B424024|nr:uncharacterized protein LOC110433629 [Sorghum bicolor]|eukprot:XP_021311801.1 uncharacterized protein LOC110433629 [Sorghum bicolor]
MAQSSGVAKLAFGFLPPVTEKLTRGNYGMWHAQVSHTLKGARLATHIRARAMPPAAFVEPDPPIDTDGKKKAHVPNLEYEEWIVKDSHVLNYLFSSLSKEIFSQVSSAASAAALWAAIQELHASQCRARVIATRMTLATASKGTSTVAE